MLRARVFRVQLHANTVGTIITGSYGYELGAQVALSNIHRILFAIVIGVLCVVFGIIGLFAWAWREGWLIPLGIFILGGLILCFTARVVANSNDHDFLRERDYIVQYLERVLDAKQSGTYTVSG